MKHPILPAVLLALAAPVTAAPCGTSGSALGGLLDAEYAFAAAARSSVRQAFLANLSEDSWVLEPTPTPGRSWYQSSSENDAQLEWFPAVADIAGSQDLGFSSGPWTYRKGSSHVQGHFLTIWRLESACRWRVLFDGGISHPAATSEVALRPRDLAAPPTAAPAGAGGGEAEDFQGVAGREGLSAALRTYARNGNFLMLTDGLPPMSLGQAEPRYRKRVIKGPWQEAVHGQSADGSLRYLLGQLGPGSYVEIWQFDPKVVNWGLRVLLLTGN